MKTVKWLMMAAVSVTAILGGTGCSTTKPAVCSVETVTFSNPIPVPDGPKLRDKNDPQEYIKYCLSLSECGRHESAGDFLMEAGQRFHSQRNEFSIDAYAAAASEYFYAGEMDKFREAVLTLKRTADRYQSASFDAEISTLIDLGNVIDGASQPNEATTASLRKIYKQNR